LIIAAERYAKGEITRDEYLKMLDDLRASDHLVSRSCECSWLVPRRDIP
jgi:hypothetical protein